MIRSTTKQRKSRWNRNKDTIFIVVLASIGEIASALSSSCALAIVRHHIYIIIVAIAIIWTFQANFRRPSQRRREVPSMSKCDKMAARRML